jgi:acetoin utilization protein AcuB
MAHETTIREHMSPEPYTIGAEQTLERAVEVMRKHRVRHLPVLEARRLVGILSERDVALVSAMAGVDPSAVPVSEAMTPDPYATTPDAPLAKVVHEMARRKLGAAVVLDDGAVLGIFTAVDALALLSTFLER